MPLSGNVSSRQAISYLRGIGISDIRMETVPSEFPDLVMGARYGDTPIVDFDSQAVCAQAHRCLAVGHVLYLRNHGRGTMHNFPTW